MLCIERENEKDVFIKYLCSDANIRLQKERVSQREFKHPISVLHYEFFSQITLPNFLTLEPESPIRIFSHDPSSIIYKKGPVGLKHSLSNLFYTD